MTNQELINGINEAKAAIAAGDDSLQHEITIWAFEAELEDRAEEAQEAELIEMGRKALGGAA